jgi:hypothetical protein
MCCSPCCKQRPQQRQRRLQHLLLLRHPTLAPRCPCSPTVVSQVHARAAPQAAATVAPAAAAATSSPAAAALAAAALAAAASAAAASAAAASAAAVSAAAASAAASPGNRWPAMQSCSSCWQQWQQQAQGGGLPEHPLEHLPQQQQLVLGRLRSTLLLLWHRQHHCMGPWALLRV